MEGVRRRGGGFGQLEETAHIGLQVAAEFGVDSIHLAIARRLAQQRAREKRGEPLHRVRKHAWPNGEVESRRLHAGEGVGPFCYISLEKTRLPVLSDPRLVCVCVLRTILLTVSDIVVPRRLFPYPPGDG